MKIVGRIIYPTAVMCVLCILGGCKAGPAPASGFIQNHKIIVNDEKSPFHSAWYDPNTNWEGYTRILVDPVNTCYITKTGWLQNITLAVDRKKDSKRIADYMWTRICEAFASDSDERFKPAYIPGPHTLILEMALVELVPTKVWLNAVGTVFALSVDYGSVAMEARIRGGETGKVIATFADRAKGKASLVSIANLTWYSHARYNRRLGAADSAGAKNRRLRTRPRFARLYPPALVTFNKSGSCIDSVLYRPVQKRQHI